MTLRFQRLLLILISLIFLTSSILLILYNSKKNLVFFYTPTELFNSEIKLGSTVRIGGFVQKNSLLNIEKNNYQFVITDNKNSIEINYIGILPDLFREQQGVVIEGKIIKESFVEASTVFAKHDENYMPASIQNN